MRQLWLMTMLSGLISLSSWAQDWQPSGSTIIRITPDGGYYSGGYYYSPLVEGYPSWEPARDTYLTIKVPFEDTRVSVNNGWMEGRGRTRTYRVPVAKNKTEINHVFITAERNGLRYENHYNVSLRYGQHKTVTLDFESSTATITDIFQDESNQKETKAKTRIEDWNESMKKLLAEKRQRIESWFGQAEKAGGGEAVQAALIEEKKRRLDLVTESEDLVKNEYKARHNEVTTFYKNLQDRYVNGGRGYEVALRESENGFWLSEEIRRKQAAQAWESKFSQENKYAKEFSVDQLIQTQKRVQAYKQQSMDPWLERKIKEYDQWKVTQNTQVSGAEQVLTAWVNDSEKQVREIADAEVRKRVTAVFQEEKKRRGDVLAQLRARVEKEYEVRKQYAQSIYDRFVGELAEKGNTNASYKDQHAWSKTEEERRAAVEAERIKFIAQEKEAGNRFIGVPELTRTTSLVVALETKLASLKESLLQEIDNWRKEESAPEGRYQAEAESERQLLEGISSRLVRNEVTGAWKSEEARREAYLSKRSAMLDAERDLRKGSIEKIFQEALDSITQGVQESAAISQIETRIQNTRAGWAGFERTIGDLEVEEAKLKGAFLGVSVLRENEMARYPIAHQLPPACTKFTLGLETDETIGLYFEKRKVASLEPSHLVDIACREDRAALIVDQEILNRVEKPSVLLLEGEKLLSVVTPQLEGARFTRVWVQEPESYLVSMERQEDRFVYSMRFDGSSLDEHAEVKAPDRSPNLFTRSAP